MSVEVCKNFRQLEYHDVLREHLELKDTRKS